MSGKWLALSLPKIPWSVHRPVLRAGEHEADDDANFRDQSAMAPRGELSQEYAEMRRPMRVRERTFQKGSSDGGGKSGKWHELASDERDRKSVV